MICGIDVDALLGGLQDELKKAKEAALGMVNSSISDAKAAAEKMKADAEAQIRLWMAELPELPELPKIPMSVELMALVSKLTGYATQLSAGNLSQDAKDAINKEIAKAKKAFINEWGDGLDKAGVDLDKLLGLLEGGSIDPCALIPNLQKGVDGAIELLPNMPKFPIAEGIAELESVVSETADKAKGVFKEYSAEFDGAVKSVATAVKNAADDATIKASRAGLAPAGNRARKQALLTK